MSTLAHLAGFRDKVVYLVIAVWRGPLRQQPEPEDLDVLVVSPGGVATTALIKHLRRYRRVNWSDDSDWLKHLPRPPRTAVLKIFVTGDVGAISASIARRGWIDAQAAKLGSPLTILLHGDAKTRAFARCVERQITAWHSAPDTLVIHYDDLLDSAAQIQDFAKITSPDFRMRFPKRQARLSVS